MGFRGKRSFALNACTCAFLAALLLPFSSWVANPVHAEAGSVPVGADLGDAVYSDIRAYVSGNELPSINVDGYTAVYADDLRKSGFEVEWLPADRNVVLTPSPGKPLEAALTDEWNGIAPGAKVADVLATDMTVDYGSVRIPSYNINGRTAIVLNDLDRFGSLVWSEEERILTFTPGSFAASPYSGDHPPLTIEATRHTEIEPLTVSGSDWLLGDRKVGAIGDNQKLMVQLRPFAEKLGFTIKEDTDTHTWIVGDGTSQFEVAADSKGPKLLWLGGAVPGPDWTSPPVWSDDGWLLEEQDVRLLLGCVPNPGWDWQKPPFAYECPDYRLKDAGIAHSADTLRYEVTAAVYANPDTMLPSVIVENTVADRRVFDGRMYTPENRPEVNGILHYTTASDTPLVWADNHIHIQVAFGWRVLYDTQFTLTPEKDTTKAAIDYGSVIPHGTFTKLETTEPELAYHETDADSYRLSGTVAKPFGQKLIWVIEKQEAEGSWREVWETSEPMPADGAFDSELPLPAGTGLYQIRLQSEGESLVFSNTMDVAKWLINKTSGDPVPPPIDPDTYVPPVSDTPVQLSGEWKDNRYPERFVGWRGYPFALSVADQGMNSPRGYWYGSPVTIGMTIANVGEETLTLQEPVSFELMIYKWENNKQVILWSGRLPAVDRTFAPLDYSTITAQWDGRDSDGNLVPPGDYILGLRVPVDLDYKADGSDKTETETASTTIRTQMPLILEWPNES